MSKYYYNADVKSKQEIMDEFVRIYMVGTSRDCRIVVDYGTGDFILVADTVDGSKEIYRWK